MRRVARCAVGAGLICCACSGDAVRPATMVDLAQPWTRATPAAAGMDPELTTRAESAAASVSRVRALLVARRGRLVVERYFGGADSTTRFDVRSVTKAIVSAVTGIAIARGRLPGVGATVGTYIGAPDTLDRGDSAVTIAELLTMTSGYQWNETNGNDYNLWVTSPAMPKYLIEREIPNAAALSAADLKKIAQRSCTVLQELGPTIQWVQSFVTEDKITCVYIAPNADLIREHARLGGFPADRVLEIATVIDPTTAESNELATA